MLTQGAWVHLELIQPPSTQQLPNIVTVEEAMRLFAASRLAS